MFSFLSIFFNTRRTFDYLYNQYEDKLEDKCLVIFALLGATNGIQSQLQNATDIEAIYGDRMLILSSILFILIGAAVGVLMGRYIISNIIIGLSKLLKGAGENVDLRVVTAYSIVPFLFKLPLLIYYWITGTYLALTEMESRIFMGIILLLWIFSLKILFTGLRAINKYGVAKTIINMFPFIVVFLWQVIVTVNYLTLAIKAVECVH